MSFIQFILILLYVEVPECCFIYVFWSVWTQSQRDQNIVFKGRYKITQYKNKKYCSMNTTSVDGAAAVGGVRL